MTLSSDVVTKPFSSTPSIAMSDHFLGVIVSAAYPDCSIPSFPRRPIRSLPPPHRKRSLLRRASASASRSSRAAGPFAPWRGLPPHPARSLPLQRALLPLIYEADDQNQKEQHHRQESEHADVLQHDRPGKKKRDLEVEQDEQDCDEVVTDVELHPRVLESLEAAFIGRQLFRIRTIGRDDAAGCNHQHAESETEQDEQQDGEILV